MVGEHRMGGLTCQSLQRRPDEVRRVEHQALKEEHVAEPLEHIGISREQEQGIPTNATHLIVGDVNLVCRARARLESSAGSHVGPIDETVLIHEVYPPTLVLSRRHALDWRPEEQLARIDQGSDDQDGEREEIVRAIDHVVQIASCQLHRHLCDDRECVHPSLVSCLCVVEEIGLERSADVQPSKGNTAHLLDWLKSCTFDRVFVTILKPST